MKNIVDKEILKETCMTMFKLSAFISVGIIIPTGIYYSLNLYAGSTISIIFLIVYVVLFLFICTYYSAMKRKKEIEKYQKK